MAAAIRRLAESLNSMETTTIEAPRTAAKPNPAAEADFLPLQGTDYVEFYVGNAKQAAHFYKTAFGFQSLAYAGPETGLKDRVSYVIRQNKLTFVLTTPLRAKNEIADHIYKHGDGVKYLALESRGRDFCLEGDNQARR